MFKKRTIKTGTKRKLEADAGDMLESTQISTDTTAAKRRPAPATSTKPTRKTFHPEARAAPNVSELENVEETKKITGPKAAPKNIRVTKLVDFQPDVCKDFQQTGYCGYGDTCKFLHIREELKQKKPIEKEWQNVGVAAAEAKTTVPFKCPICKNDYHSPAKTSCGHIFCQQCFLGRFKANKPKCFICGKDTGGSVVPLTKRERDELAPAMSIVTRK